MFVQKKLFLILPSVIAKLQSGHFINDKTYNLSSRELRNSFGFLFDRNERSKSKSFVTSDLYKSSDFKKGGKSYLDKKY